MYWWGDYVMKRITLIFKENRKRAYNAISAGQTYLTQVMVKKSNHLAGSDSYGLVDAPRSHEEYQSQLGSV